MSNLQQVPWDDCRVAFGVDASAEELWAWAERYRKYFPAGWSFDSTDATGARMVVVFRVEGRVFCTDGEMIAKSLRSLERSIQK